MTTGPCLARRRPAGSFLPGVVSVAAAWLLCVGFAAPASAADAVDVWINVTLSGVTQVNLNVSELNTTRLLEKLNEYKTSDVVAFQALAGALIKAMSTQLDASGVEDCYCKVRSEERSVGKE